MGCGGCQKELDALRAELVDVKSTLHELLEEYLTLARLYDVDHEDGQEAEEVGDE